MGVFRRPEELTGTEKYVQSEFGAAVELAARIWREFVDHNRSLDADWEDTFTLRQRLKAFMNGTIFSTLETRFPQIGSLADEADDLTELEGHELVLLLAIVGEGVIAAGTNSREEVRASLIELA